MECVRGKHLNGPCRRCGLAFRECHAWYVILPEGMMQRTTMARQLVVLGVLASGVGLTGCYAKKKDVREEFARVRSEMTTADQQLTAKQTELTDQVSKHGTRLDAVEADVQKMRTELSDLNVKVTRLNGLIAFDVPVHFDFNA